MMLDELLEIFDQVKIDFYKCDKNLTASQMTMTERLSYSNLVVLNVDQERSAQLCNTAKKLCVLVGGIKLKVVRGSFRWNREEVMTDFYFLVFGPDLETVTTELYEQYNLWISKYEPEVGFSG